MDRGINNYIPTTIERKFQKKKTSSKQILTLSGAYYELVREVVGTVS